MKESVGKVWGGGEKATWNKMIDQRSNCSAYYIQKSKTGRSGMSTPIPNVQTSASWTMLTCLLVQKLHTM